MTARDITTRQAETLLREAVATRLGADAGAVDVRRPLASYGLTSVDLVGLVGQLEPVFGRPLPATLVWQYPTIEELARHLSTDPPAVDNRVDAPGERQPQPREHTDRRPVAVVGIGCRLPGGVTGPDRLWQALRQGRDLVGEVPPGRWDVAALTDPDPQMPGTMITSQGGFVADVDRFDADFFGISPREAASMDPQQRLLAEVAWETAEDAGVPMGSLARRPVGVYVGISNADYRSTQGLGGCDAYAATGSALSIAANRLSYLFDLRGPSLAVDTACSSSLVAIHLAASSVARGECDLAFAGGVNLILEPDVSVAFTKMTALSPGGRCRAFDAAADGFVRSEGAVLVLLKPLQDALDDADRIYAVVRGGAVTQDGRTNGLAAPNPLAQEAVLRAAYADAGVDPRLVGYVEAHGTGTLLGDPIEAQALGAVVGRDRSAPLRIGSAKTNLGHAESAAGAVGFVKAALMARHRADVPTVHFRTPNPHIDFEALRLQVCAEHAPWSPERSDVLGVSSFGFGGTNAHVVLQSPPQPEAAPSGSDATAPVVLAMSADDEDALGTLATAYRDLLSDADDETTRAVCRASLVRRDLLDVRRTVVAPDLAALRAAVTALQGESPDPATQQARRADRPRRVVFVFPGQSARWWPLPESVLGIPAFRATLTECAAALRELAGLDLLDLVQRPADDDTLDDPGLGQPALVAVQLAYAAAWRSWGVEPAAVVGHSVGEVAAAAAAGALSVADAMRVSLERGRAIAPVIGGGAMAVVALSAADTQAAIDACGLSRVWPAAFNAAHTTVVSGDTAEVARFVERVTASGGWARPIIEQMSYASHSPMMTPVARELEARLGGLRPGSARVPMWSTATGAPVDGTELDAAYWGANLRSPVRLDEVVGHLVGTEVGAIVELGPRAVLVEALDERAETTQPKPLVLGSGRSRSSDGPAVWASLSRLLVDGHPVNRVALAGGQPVAHVDLPANPWRRQRHWRESRAAAVPSTGHPLLVDEHRPAVGGALRTWTSTVDLARLAYLADHVVAGQVVAPASLLVDAFAAVADQVEPSPAEGPSRHDGPSVPRPAATRLRGLRLHLPVVVPALAEAPNVQVVLEGDAAPYAVSLHVREATGTWVRAADARVGPGDEPACEDLVDVRARCAQQVDTASLYARFAGAGLSYGPAFRGLSAVWSAPGEAVGRLARLADLLPDRGRHVIHPALLDAALQLIGPALGGSEAAMVPAALDDAWVLAGRPAWAHARVRTQEGDLVVADVAVYDADGRALASLVGVQLRPAARSGAGALASSVRHLRWVQPAELAPADPTATNGGWWLVVGPTDPLTDSVATELAARGAAVTRLGVDGLTPTADPADPARLLAMARAARRGIASAIATLQAADGSLDCRGVVYAPGTSTGAPPQPDELDAGLLAGVGLVQALLDTGVAPGCLAVLTRGTQDAAGERAVTADAQAALWGLGRVVQSEHAELAVRLLDLPSEPAAMPSAATVVDHLARPRTGPAQWAWREGWLQATLGTDLPAPAGSPWREVPATGSDVENVALMATEPGILASLRPVVTRRHPPGAGEVEIEVTAAGLNFNDVLTAMDICPGVAPGVHPLGGECSGVVRRVGADVEGLRPDDAVMAVAPAAMGRFTTTPAGHTRPIPDGVDPVEAAAIPIAFLTAVYGLEYLARLRAGEVVLVHSASGGVGMAALQVAARCGARVIATAGTSTKRAALRRAGVEAVFDSRDPEMAEQVREATAGAGVDVVLNSLTGAGLRDSLGLLRPGGRFIEIGKHDIYTDTPIGLGSLRGDRSFLAVDLALVARERPTLLAELFDLVCRGFAAGDFSVPPVTARPLARAAEAFTDMARARHVGKLVLTAEPTASAVVRAETGPPSSDLWQLVTGGLSGLGWASAQHLVAQGARRLALVGRSEMPPAVADTVAGWRADGLDVWVERLDVADGAGVDALVERIEATGVPLGGIVHAAGVLDDAPIEQLDEERIRRMLRGKVHGAWNLHRATLGRPLDHFVMYSSASALLGVPGQGAYAAANALVDALGRHRRALGMPSLSIAWGPWAETGMVAGSAQADALGRLGVGSVRTADGLALLDELLAGPSGEPCVLLLDPQGRAGWSLVGDGLLAQADTGDDPAAGSDLRGLLESLPYGRARTAALTEHCRTAVAEVLGQQLERVDPRAPLAGMGFDSLMSLELRRRLERSLGVSLPATVVWQHPSIEALVPFLASSMGVELQAPSEDPAAGLPASSPTGTPASGAQQRQPTPGPADPVEPVDLDDLDPAQLEQLLLVSITELEGRQP